MFKRYFLGLFLVKSLCVFGQSDKLLDSYGNTSDYFTSAFPSGSISLSLDNSSYTHDSNSLRLDYSIPGGIGNFVECFRNYGTHTQDLSFQPDYISLQVKGESGNVELFRYWIYEDINMNGASDAEDEIWYVDAPAGFLNSTSFNQLNLSFSSFLKFSGSGNSVLDLNRVRALRITIQNTTAVAKNGSVWVDELRLNTTYPPASSGASHVNGTFVQIWNGTGCNCGGWNQARWEQEIDSMQALCMDKIIVQYGVYDNNAWYTPSSLGFVTFTNSTLNNLVAACEQKNFKIWFGLYFDEDWNTDDKSLQATYDNVELKHQGVIDELYSLFGSSSAFEGWYIPQEINDLEWQTDGNRDKLANWLQDVSSYAHSKDSTKKVMISPFFNLWQPADVVHDWYDTVLTIAQDIDLVQPQDGVGITLKDVDVDIPHYYSAIKSACDNHSVEFGSNIEIFEQTDGWPVNANAFAAIPGNFSRIEEQLWESSVHTNDIIQFSWFYCQPDMGGQHQQLYSDLKQNAGCFPTGISSENQMLSVHPNPATSTLSVSSDLTKAEVELINFQGVRMLSGSANSFPFQLDISSLSSGVYLLKVNSEKQVFIRSVLKL